MARRGMGGLWKVLVGSILILIIAQALNGGLTLSSLRKVYFQSLVATVKVTGIDAVLKIEGAVRFGKPIEAFYGMQKLADGVREALPELDDIVLSLPDGREAYRFDPARPAVTAAVAAALPALAKGERVVLARRGGDHLAIFAVRAKTGALAGTLALAFPDAAARASFDAALADNLKLLGLTTAAAVLAILLRFAVLGRGRAGGVSAVPLSGARLTAVPLIAIVLAQGYYSFETVRGFRDEYISVTRSSTERLTNLVKRDLETILGKGVKITSLFRIEDEFQRIINSVPEIADIEIRDTRRTLLYKADRDGKVAGASGAATEADSVYDPDPAYDIVLPLQPRAADGSRTATAGYITIHLSADRIGEGVRQRMLDSGTMVLLAALAVFELSILLRVLVRRSLNSSLAEEVATRHLLARPAVFTFLLAWALPLSFVPLRMQDLYEPLAGLPEAVMMALPISLEMLCALATALLAGALTDRRGWHVPFLGGVAVSIAGALLAGNAGTAVGFILARGVVGLGYGLAWMGIQGFIFHYGTPATRAQGVANLVAGIFAGHICGTAIGAMLAEQIGFVPVFLVSAGAMLVPLAFVLVFMRPYMKPHHAEGAAMPGRHRAAEPASAPASAATGSERTGLRAVLLDRNFVALLLLSVVPFSIAQVGLLYYSLPIYLARMGVNQSDIGRILMIYGLSVIYVAPMIGRFVDRTPHKRLFIAAGGLIGGGGLVWLYANHGMGAMILAVFLLGMASCLSGGAQSAFALNLRSVQSYGAGKAMGVQRAADKLGQMLGPLIVGALFTSVGIEVGLAVTGGLYLVATVLFLGVAGERPLWARLAHGNGAPSGRASGGRAPLPEAETGGP